MVEVWGTDFSELVTESARALFSIITDLDTVRAENRVPIELRAESDEQLLVTWLTELLFLHETELWLFSRFDIQTIGDGAIKAEAWGERLDPGRHPIDREVKAVTYHRLSLERNNDRFRTTIVFDL
jgi:SHS2 domain-containing protein